jgi:hypothetical protein
MTILIDNFSIGIREWALIPTLEYFAVDVSDSTYGIDLVNTYFLHNGVEVFTSYSGITDGYRCFYEPISLVSSGVIDITIHAENTISGTADQIFHFLYGYHCAFNELIDWGSNAEVVTTIEAANLAFCPNVEADTIYFETADAYSADLGAYIKAIESVDLGAQIFPQNAFFFYGRTYTITISGVKDLAGNETAPYTFSFTIENSTI